MLETTCFVDWVSYVVEASPLPRTREDFLYWFNRLQLGNAQVRRCKPRNAYRTAYTNKNGAIMQTSVGREDMGINVLLTGSVLGSYKWFEVLKLLNDEQGHFARLDITIDAMNSALNIEGLYNDLKFNDASTRAKKHSLVQSETGLTLYLGSRSSDRYLRIYDKAGQMGEPGKDWKRVELELSGDRATWVADYIVSEGETSIKDLILDYVDFPDSPEWQSVFRDVTPVQSVSHKKVSDTQKWLLSTVAKSAAVEMLFDPDFEEKFKQAIAEKLQEITNNPNYNQ